MTFKNPYVNSLYAEIYIILIASAMNLLKSPNTPDKPFDGVVFLSLFVLSAAVMGFIFVSEPVQLYLNGEKTQAVSFFGKTVGAFAVLTVIAVGVMRALR